MCFQFENFCFANSPTFLWHWMNSMKTLQFDIIYSNVTTEKNTPVLKWSIQIHVFPSEMLGGLKRSVRRSLYFPHASVLPQIYLCLWVPGRGKWGGFTICMRMIRRKNFKCWAVVSESSHGASRRYFFVVLVITCFQQPVTLQLSGLPNLRCRVLSRKTLPWSYDRNSLCDCVSAWGKKPKWAQYLPL